MAIVQQTFCAGTQTALVKAGKAIAFGSVADSHARSYGGCDDPDGFCWPVLASITGTILDGVRSATRRL